MSKDQAKKRGKKKQEKNCQCHDSKFVPELGSSVINRKNAPPNIPPQNLVLVFFVRVTYCVAYERLVLLFSLVHHIAAFGRTVQ